MTATRPSASPFEEFVIVYYDSAVTSEESIWSGLKAVEAGSEHRGRMGVDGDILGRIQEGVRTERVGLSARVDNPVATRGDLFRITLWGSDAAPEVDLPEGWRILDRSAVHVVVRPSPTAKRPRKYPIVLRCGDREIRLEAEMVVGMAENEEWLRESLPGFSPLSLLKPTSGEENEGVGGGAPLFPKTPPRGSPRKTRSSKRQPAPPR